MKLFGCLALASIATGSPAAQAPCTPAWLPNFGSGSGVNGELRCAVTFDDGSGPALYVGGALWFTAAGGVHTQHIARWDGKSWSALGSGVQGDVCALAVFDDGSGPALYAGGMLGIAGVPGTSSIAKWDGTSWSALAGGLTASFATPNVLALAVYDDGGGPALYAGGYFTSAGGVPANSIAKWDGTSWSALGSGASPVYALAVFDDGGGSALYVGGYFASAGGVAVQHIAKWNGSTWSALAGGGTNDTLGLRALAVFDDGSGPALYAGGNFDFAGTTPANCVAKWDGAGWSALGSGITSGTSELVETLAVHDDGSGPALYVGGQFTHAGGQLARNIASWNGTGWSALASGMSWGDPSAVAVNALAVFDEGSGPALFACGSFLTAGGIGASSIARWHASAWSPVGEGLDGSVGALAEFDDGSGNALYAGGEFKSAGGQALNHLARWNGAGWTALGSGIAWPNNEGETSVNALEVFDDGAGAALYAGGFFVSAGGQQANHLAKWDGTSWSPMAVELFSYVYALQTYDDGSGLALYAGGYSTQAGSTPVLQKWNGSSWSALGAGLGGFQVRALTTFDDGGGRALYVGGWFSSAGGAPASNVAKWDGTSWSALGSGTNDVVRCLTVFDDGGGPALYAGGLFTVAGGVAAKRVAKWNGSSWSALGSGMNASVVDALAGFDDGIAAALYAGGSFTNAGGVPVSHIARWDGAGWSAVGSGVGPAGIGVLRVFDDGSGPALLAGGPFRVSPAGDSFLASYGTTPGCGAPGTALCEPGVGGVIVCPCANPPSGPGRGCDNSSATGGAKLEASGIARLSYDTVVLRTRDEKPTATSIVLQGDGLAAGGVVFGQGVRCVAGNLKRLYTKTAVAGSITAPQAGDLDVHTRSAELGDAIAAGTQRYYGVYYRDPTVLGGCPAVSTFNVTQQLAVLWTP